MAIELNLVKYNPGTQSIPNTIGATAYGMIPLRAADSYEQNTPSPDIFLYMIDGVISAIDPVYGGVLGNDGYLIKYLFPEGMDVKLDKVRMNTTNDLSQPDEFTIAALKADGSTATASSYIPDTSMGNNWQISASMGSLPVIGFICTVYMSYPFEIQLVGTYNEFTYGDLSKFIKYPFENMTGIVGHEWDVIQGYDPDNLPNGQITGPIYEAKYDLLKLFEGRFRHYFKWSRFEVAEDDFYLEPTPVGNWTYKTMYGRFKQDSKKIQLCLQACPDYIIATYDTEENEDTTPVDSMGLDKSLPSSYQRIGYCAYNLAGQLGNNPDVDISTLKLDETPLYPQDPTHNFNTLEKALGMVDYIEIGNERDTWFNYPDIDLGYQNGLEFVAMMSMAYDGHQGTFPNCGAKVADPSIKVAFAGLAYMSHNRYKDMVEAARTLRGYKKDVNGNDLLDVNGSKIIDVPWDVIAVHFYSNTSELKIKDTSGAPVTGCRLELTNFEDRYLRLQDVNHRFTNALPIQIGEFGWDLSPNSTQGIIVFGSKTNEQIQADWFAAATLYMSALGVFEIHLYETYSIDQTYQSGQTYGSTGLLKDFEDATYGTTAAANVLHQMNNLLRGSISISLQKGEVWINKRTISNVDYYCIWKPTQDDSSIPYTLNLGYDYGSVTYGTYTYSNDENITMYPATGSVIPMLGYSLTLTITEAVTFVKNVRG